jgi:fibronectin type 3 domain-containing protein
MSVKVGSGKFGSGSKRIRRAVAATTIERLEARHLLAAPPAGSVDLTGSITGTAGSYNNQGNTVANAFDGNLNSYFDAPTGNGDFAGLALAAPAAITQIQYAPRPGWAARMVGGVFQASSTSDFSSNVVTLYTITAAPTVGVLTNQLVSPSGTYQYLRYLAPAGSFGDVAELEFDGVPTTATPVGTQLTGAVIGTPGSFSNLGNTIANAFDGNLNTYVDGATANGNWAGLDLGAPAATTTIQYAPRAQYNYRMVGGTFQGSSTADFSSGVVNLYTITVAPQVGMLTVVPITTAGTFRYVRYLSPAGSFGNVAEVQFDGTPGTVTNPYTKLSGAVVGTAGSYQNDGNTIANAFDGNLSTFFDGPTGNGNVAGLNLGAPATISQVQYAPRPSWAGRMVGGTFQASSTSDFSSGVVSLYTITAVPAYGVLTAVPVSVAGTYQYVRYVSPAGSFGDVAEIEFDGTAGVVTPTKLTGTPFGTAGSYGNSGNTIANAFDGNLSTYFDGPTGNGDIVGLNLGAEANLSQIQYAPRPGWAARMVGGTFQASNASDFSSGPVVNLFTITAAPTVGVLTAVPVSVTGAYQYIRYVAPASSFGDVAEIEIDGVTTGVVSPPIVPSVPSVLNSNPANGATGVSRTAFVSCALNLPNVGAGVSIYYLNSSNVYLYRTYDHTLIPSVTNTDGAGGDLVLQPDSPLDANTSYTFVVTSNLEDTTGAHFQPYQATFTTNDAAIPTVPNIAFSDVPQPTATGQQFTGVAIGPDGNLYASTLTGDVFKFPIAADGTLGNPTDIKTAITANGGAVIITGLAFDPASTAANMTLWLSIGSGAISNAPNFTGEIATISGPGFSVYQNYVTGLPRSNSNHLNEEPVFGPDGNLYWSQGSLSSMGAPDSVWGYRTETLLSAAILQLNVAGAKARIAAGLGPINVQTDSLPAGQTAYNPYAAGALVTPYATGIRNAFDLVFDSNGHLYAPTNGAASTGNIPATPAGVTPAAPAENDVPNAEDDYLYDIQQGGYYGHPDPARGQYIFGGGNPVNPAPNTAIQGVYPLGTNPDPNYRGYAFDFGAHYSPDGIIEYEGSAFGGALNGDLLVTEYSGGKDIDVLTVGATGAITGSITGITGLSGFNGPLGLVEDQANGFVYMADLGAETLTLIKPIASGATANVSAPTVYFNDPTGGAAGPAQTVTISNTGNQPLAIPQGGISIVGTDGVLFRIGSEPTLPATIAPGSSVSFTISYDAGSSALGIHTATLQIQSNDPVNPMISVALRAISTAGTGGNLEPSLQRILNLYQIPDNVGTADPSQTYFNTPPLTPNDEVVMQELIKADPNSPVTVTPIAAFSATITPSAGFGWYTAGTPDSRTPVFSVDAADSQSVDVTPQGTTTFDPGSGIFGIFASFDAFPNTATGTSRFAYSEDVFNTYDAVNTRKVRFYPLKNANGTVVPNAFVFATEDYGVAPGYDSNDLVGIIYNVEAAPGNPKIGLQNVNGTTDIEGASFPNQLEFDAIQNPTAQVPTNVTHTQSTVRIDNSGNQPLVITSITSPSSAFELPANLSFPMTIAAGSYFNLTITYAPTHTGTTTQLDNGILYIFSNDPVKPKLGVNLSGIWQDYGNMLPNGTYTEPSVSQIVNTTFGYGTAITYAGQTLNQGGVIETAGQEVLSPYWVRADSNLPVTVRQLASFHTQGNGATLYGYALGSPTRFTTITSSTGDNGQSLLPLTNDKTAAPAFGLYYPTGVFGLNVDKSEYSDNSLNAHGTATDQGHHVRFWPACTPSGVVIPNEWIMAIDYTSAGENYDYNDNVYLITNMTPAPPATPAGVTASGSVSGVTLTWSAVTDPLLAGYNVFRSTSAKGIYTQVNAGPITTNTYVDKTGTPGTAYYYEVVAFDSWGGVSGFSAAVAGTRLKNTTPPAAPANLSASPLTTGIVLTWTANTEPDLAGYNVLRATSPTGTYYSLNLSLLTSPTFTDTSASQGSPSYYEVVAVNASGVSSAASAVTATRPVNVAPPVAPTNFAGTPSSTGVLLGWTSVSGTTVAGYNVYRATSAAGAYVKLNSGLIATTSFNDPAAVTGATFYYRVTAVDIYGQESTPAPATVVSLDFTPPAQPAGFTATGVGTGIQLNWTANTEPDVAGYNLLRSSSATGTFTKINTALLTGTSYLDTTTTPGFTAYYQLVAVDTSGNASTAAAASAFYGDVIPPATPKSFAAAGQTTGNALAWLANSEPDVIGYNVYWSTSASGPFTKLNASLVTGLSYLDTTAIVGQPTYYELTAVNTTGIASATPATAVATRPAIPPTPTGFTAAGSAGNVVLTWNANTEPLLAGYVLQRATSPTGPFASLSATLLTGTNFTDTTAVAGATYYYQLTAQDTTGVQSAAASAVISE